MITLLPFTCFAPGRDETALELRMRTVQAVRDTELCYLTRSDVHGLYAAYPVNHPIELGFIVTLRLDWTTGHIYFSVPGEPHVTAPRRLPPEVRSVVPWVHADAGTSSARGAAIFFLFAGQRSSTPSLTK